MSYIVENLELSPETKNGLLAYPYVMHNRTVKNVVNLNNKDLIGAYGYPGADFSNVFRSTNAKKIYFIDTEPTNVAALYYWIDKWETIEMQGKYIEGKGYVENYEISDYHRLKYIHGFAKVDFLKDEYKKGYYFARQVVRELKAMGVPKEDIIDISIDEDGYINLIFKWTYDKNSSKKERIVVFVNEDITKTSEILNDRLNSKLDFYYQRAAMTAPEKYPQFIKTIAKWIKPLGFMITDDYVMVADKECSFELSEFRLLQLTEDMEFWAKEIIRYQKHSCDGIYGHYGWCVSLRQRIILEEVITSEITNSIDVVKSAIRAGV